MAPLISLLLFLATGEIALRVIYRDAGVRTLGGPGGRQFEHRFVLDNQRGRYDDGPRRPGVQRLMAIGDSVTWGQGVREWLDLWPEQLATRLEGDGRTYEMVVLSQPGRNIPQHLEELRTHGRRADPDAIVYQWHPNDIEVTGTRPFAPRAWQTWRYHEGLRSASYLYFFLDSRLAQLLPAVGPTYTDYLLGLGPGSMEWAEFERYFHSFATLAREIAPTRLLLLYPHVPFKGAYPLRELNDRMRALAGPHQLLSPPSGWYIRGGTLEVRGDAPWHRIARMPHGAAATVDTDPYYVADGPLDVVLTMAGLGQAAAGEVGAFDVVDAATHGILARTSVQLNEGDGRWEKIRLRSDLTGRGGRDVRFRFVSSGTREVALASLEMAVDYGMTVVDLAEPLNSFDTHASIFDAHPNERAHAVIADEVFKALKSVGFVR